ncbi:hypothetical protein MLD38_036562 [Melastoma candidum]|uniref:Uncharacterized protein n=1 Tax=Melastoma candidum TaxID=119954 RepID=A0ACB9LJX7_9MYRT|nr:hypothetical protein MLD38_036562 [Melastoma candidum]
MCMTNEDQIPKHRFHSYSKNRPKTPKVRVGRFTRRRNEKRMGKDIELKNLKLYLENQTIIEENEKLRKQADLLHQENLALLSEIQKRFTGMNTSRKLTAGVLETQL